MPILSYICYTDFEYINYQAYSSTCNSLSPILDNTLLQKFDTSSEKRNESDKYTNFLMANKKSQKSICKRKLVFFTLNSPPLARDETCSKLQRYGENIGDKKLPV